VDAEALVPLVFWEAEVPVLFGGPSAAALLSGESNQSGGFALGKGDEANAPANPPVICGGAPANPAPIPPIEGGLMPKGSCGVELEFE